MRKPVFDFPKIEPWPGVKPEDWGNWKWQLKNSLKNKQQFGHYFELSEAESKGLEGVDQSFRAQCTPYYASLASRTDRDCSVRKMVVPLADELVPGLQQMLDPLGENKKDNRPCERLIHRYEDRALFLVTDLCGIYCRYCTRKHFTASDQVVATRGQIQEAVEYLKKHQEIKEVILSGGDPLTLGTSQLRLFFEAIESVPHVELIRVASRFPVVNPFRIDDELISLFKEFRPIYFMTHFNHPDELSEDSALALEKLVQNGVPVMNQLVLLNGINNHEAIIYALSRRLLYLGVKPYYMFQADPSLGTDHLRTSIEDSLEIQKKLWGKASGLSMPQLIVDIPSGGGKAPLVPEFQTNSLDQGREYEGYDGVKATYLSPIKENIKKPKHLSKYQLEW